MPLLLALIFLIAQPAQAAWYEPVLNLFGAGKPQNIIQQTANQENVVNQDVKNSVTNQVKQGDVKTGDVSLVTSDKITITNFAEIIQSLDANNTKLNASALKLLDHAGTTLKFSQEAVAEGKTYVETFLKLYEEQNKLGREVIEKQFPTPLPIQQATNTQFQIVTPSSTPFEVRLRGEDMTALQTMFTGLQTAITAIQPTTTVNVIIEEDNTAQVQFSPWTIASTSLDYLASVLASSTATTTNTTQTYSWFAVGQK